MGPPCSGGAARAQAHKGLCPGRRRLVHHPQVNQLDHLEGVSRGEHLHRHRADKETQDHLRGHKRKDEEEDFGVAFGVALPALSPLRRRGGTPLLRRRIRRRAHERREVAPTRPEPRQLSGRRLAVIAVLGIGGGVKALAAVDSAAEHIEVGQGGPAGQGGSLEEARHGHPDGAEVSRVVGAKLHDRNHREDVHHHGKQKDDVKAAPKALRQACQDNAELLEAAHEVEEAQEP
mmetsp:Transcript_46992/g.106422  ORF Transcript_46992/g.106422 Transcript_46992/m.106422 type:complete len:233 (-) Transcript_46992:56-754(-)